MDEREKRHARQFEPPPWEREAFDEFQRLKAEREKEIALEEALIAARAHVEEGPREPQEAGTEVESDAGEHPADEALGGKALSSAELETMLIGLRGQEPVAAKSYTLIANAVSAILVAGGIGFVIWAATLFAKVGPESGPTPTLASLLLMVWGFLLIGGGGLLFKKYNLS